MPNILIVNHVRMNAEELENRIPLFSEDEFETERLIRSAIEISRTYEDMTDVYIERPLKQKKKANQYKSPLWNF